MEEPMKESSFSECTLRWLSKGQSLSETVLLRRSQNIKIRWISGLPRHPLILLHAPIVVLNLQLSLGACPISKTSQGLSMLDQLLFMGTRNEEVD